MADLFVYKGDFILLFYNLPVVAVTVVAADHSGQRQTEAFSVYGRRSQPPLW